MFYLLTYSTHFIYGYMASEVVGFVGLFVCVCVCVVVCVVVVVFKYESKHKRTLIDSKWSTKMAHDSESAYI